MDYGKIFRQAWKNVISYRALWIFGVILALTTGSTTTSYWSTGGGPGNQDEPFRSERFTFEPETPGEFFEMLPEIIDEVGEEMGDGLVEGNRELTRFFQEDLGLPWEADILSMITFFLWFLVISILVGAVFRYISETALIQMVHDQEETGEQRTMRYGFKVGWSPTSWRLFLIDVAIFIPTLVLFLLLFGLVFAPLLLIGTGVFGLSVIGVVLTSGLFLMFIVTAIVLDQVIQVLKQYVRRAAVLEGLGVFASIRRGGGMLRQNLKETGFVWLVLVAISIVWVVAFTIAGFILAAIAALLAGIFGLLTGLLSSLFAGQLAIVIGFIAGGVVFLLFLVLPLLLLDGLRVVFISSTWTLLFRELRSMENGTENPLPDLPEPDMLEAEAEDTEPDEA